MIFKKLKIFFESVCSVIEFIFVLFLLIFGFPFYRKTVKEIWEEMKAHKDNNRY